jgi:hypothetical protein
MKTANGNGFSSSLYGIVLAAGEGKRLELFVHMLRGNALPKQFVNFIGNRSMLEPTFDRAEKLISNDNNKIAPGHTGRKRNVPPLTWDRQDTELSSHHKHRRARYGLATHL